MVDRMRLGKTECGRPTERCARTRTLLEAKVDRGARSVVVWWNKCTESCAMGATIGPGAGDP